MLAARLGQHRVAWQIVEVAVNDSHGHIVQRFDRRRVDCLEQDVADVEQVKLDLGWTRSVPDPVLDQHHLGLAIAAAQKCGLATVGGVVQFRIPAGTCELYWRCADAESQRPGELWSEYVARSAG